MAKRNGGIIGPSNVPTGQYGGTASGVWRLRDAFNYQKAGLWPGSASYPVANSLRFNSGSSDYLNRTPASTTNQQIFTWSSWVKRDKLGTGTDQYLFVSDNFNTSSNRFVFQIIFKSTGTEQLVVGLENSVSGTDGVRATTQVFRDTSAWYHIVVSVDTTQATASNRIKVYVNGSEVTSFATSTNPTQNANVSINQSGSTPAIGAFILNASPQRFFSGYLAETYLIDGQALTPSSFGQTDSATGIWTPLPYTGTYGTNGFYLKFANSAALGTDSSGNGNTFTANNLTSVDQSTDTPTNNFSTFNSLSKNDAGTVTFSEGNLFTAHSGTDSVYTSYSTQGVSQGKWYAEFKYEVLGSNNDIQVGVGYDIEGINRTGSYLGSSVATWGYDSANGNVYNNGSGSAYGNTFAQGDIISVALDLDNNKLYFAKNGTYQNSGVPTSGATGTGAVSITGSQIYFFGTCHDTTTSRTSSYSANFGSPRYSANSYTDGAGFGNFSYAVPAGYYALCTKNLANFG